MKIFSSITIVLLLVTIIITSCNSPAPTPVMSPTHVEETATPSVTFLAMTETSTALPIFIPTFTATSSTTPVLPTEVSIPIPGGIVYYHFVDLARFVPSQGSVVIMPDNLVLAPTQLNTVYGSDVASDLRSALEAVLNDERNIWFGDKLQITELSYSGGHVNVVLDGEYYAVASVVLTAARAQILMSLFANEAVQSVRVMINGENISNIALSNSMDAKPVDYAYTRAEIDTFMAKNAYVRP